MQLAQIISPGILESSTNSLTTVFKVIMKISMHSSPDRAMVAENSAYFLYVVL